MNTSTTLKTIVWDLDDVLNHLTAAWLENAWRIEHPDATISYAQLRSNPPLAELGTTQTEYLASLDRFRVSEAAQKLPPNPFILKWFEQNGGQFRHHVLTARPVKSAGAGAAWTFNHFGGWIRNFHFVPSPRPGESLPNYESSKAQMLARLGPVDFFVDDSPQNVSDAAKLGIEAFVFPQPWNHGDMTVAEILETIANQFQMPAADTVTENPLLK
jgi:hypothetical protein